MECGPSSGAAISALAGIAPGCPQPQRLRTLLRPGRPHSGTRAFLCQCRAAPNSRSAFIIWLKTGPTAATLHSVQTVFSGPVYVVRDNVDTDQIIPAEYLNLVPTIPDEYEKLGSYAFCGLPESLYPARFVKTGKLDSEYPIVLAGKNFGCGSSREHAPIALGSAGCRIVLAESFARIFFRNSVATGELYPCEITERLCDALKTGDVVTVDLDAGTVTVKGTGKVCAFKPLGDVRRVVDAGGLFNFARKTGMIAG